ncbi:ABC transporter substrate-binding protein [Kineococcus sp. SYSU DK001]|uniref:ABC transporter substrate-binding protein n=1 Tax=Kineococcus sp. SYSU DK001 TaxID=3383122 RepID=UPI003D7EECB6
MDVVVTRRQLVAGTAAALSAGALTGCAGSPGNGQVVMANYGGPFAAALKSVYFDPFTEQTGIEVVVVNADSARYVAMARAGRSDWDSIDADGFAVVDWIGKGIVEPLSPDVPRADTVEPEFRDYAAGGYSQSFVMAYRTSAVGPNPPQSWADFWDTAKYPGKRGWPSNHVATVEPALLADGVAAADLYPLDLDRGLAKLDELRDHLTFYESYAAIAQGLQAGSVDMAVMPNGRATALADEDPDVVVQWNGNIHFPWTACPIPRSAPNTEEVNALLKFMMDPQRQAELAEKSYYGPTLRAAYDLLPPEVLAKLPGSDEHVAVAATVDSAALSRQVDEYVARYSAWVSG